MCYFIFIFSVPLEFTILPSMEFMFLFLIHPNSSYGSTAKFYMTEIAAAHKTKFLVVFDRYETELMHYIANNLVACYDTYHPNIDIKKTYNKLGFAHRDMYAIKQMVKYIFPWCIKKPKTRKIIIEIASLAQKDESTLIKESFKVRNTFIQFCSEIIILHFIISIVFLTFYFLKIKKVVYKDVNF